MDRAHKKHFIRQLCEPNSPNFKRYSLYCDGYNAYLSEIALSCGNYEPGSQFHTKKVLDTHSPQVFVTGQRSGSCVWKSFTAALFDLFESPLTKEEHREIITALKVAALSELSTYGVSEHLYSVAHMNLCQRLQKRSDIAGLTGNEVALPECWVNKIVKPQLQISQMPRGNGQYSSFDVLNFELTGAIKRKAIDINSCVRV